MAREPSQLWGKKSISVKWTQTTFARIWNQFAGAIFCAYNYYTIHASTDAE